MSPRSVFILGIPRPRARKFWEVFAVLEKTIEKKLKKPVEAMGGLYLKWEAPGFTGVPDRLILLPGGMVVMVETKAPGKTEKRRQEYVHAQLRARGFTVFSTVDTPEKVAAVLAHRLALLESEDK